MARLFTDLFSYAHGAVRQKDLGYLVAVNDEEEKSKIAASHFFEWYQGEIFEGGEADWRTAAAAIAKKPKHQLCAIGEFGQARLWGSNDRHDETIGSGEDSPMKLGPLRGGRLVGESVYACGMKRQAYRRDPAGKWTSFGPGKGKSKGTVGFEAIDGFSEKDLYAAGWEGEIWRWDAKKWHQIDSPTNAIITAICCAGDGKVYACGRRGLLLRGRGDEWEVVDHAATKDDLWGLCWYRDTLYLSGMHDVFTLAGSKLRTVGFGTDPPGTAYELSTAEGILWSIGAKDVMAFDGKKWTRIE